MISKLQQYREAYHLTQKELAEKAGVSVRTIQRIESGTPPGGYTLKMLAAALDMHPRELSGICDSGSAYNYALIKLINLAALAFIVPPLNIILPLFLIYYKKEVDPITKQIVSLQMVWTLLAGLFLLGSIFIQRFFETGNQVLLVTLTFFVLLNLFIIFRNTIEIDKNKKLRIKLNFNLI